ncbi:serine/threonine-protein kinase [Acidomonas methanolica]|uniref:non-specific serine/threonine protein kinase n=1 Tax=Acidomonas methanolica NBRC 104435 TaxID=1231351 RepID=A0A023D8G7_ACIMT|nr:serine/threonine-protein kinase [Acidomonas methanolica]MBU2652782.1 protein kinase [Acidomonas methanolica]TCS31185.1 serine/threonine protein kinase [Acidomonas methanolica]GAJ30462.1 protein kinase [Acidomonas methanolica NBRC 104435]GBQ49777.1 hypothetical protein AA0498_1068 [Acidomonas methanolica]GEK98567.1 hypothetical protein AME01nite_10660 [Acidomonas methanolica NBRC 104435]
MTATIEMPARIGRFRIEAVLGRGAMGIVYKGHDDHIDRPVAIKLIRADLLAGEERESYFRRFRNEAKIAGRCVHANIVGLYDFSFHDGNPYLVMEYVSGIGLQQVLPRGSQRSEEEVLPIALQVLDALNYAHERGIVHRDVKPANILISPDSKLKITDFGISRLASTELTMTPLLIGTPSYMSPEQCMGAALDGRSDLFSLGSVLYELLAGHRPFTGANYTDTILGIINRPHTPLEEIRPDLSPDLVAAIDRSLSKKPEDRFPSADAFARALERIAGSLFRVPAIPRVFVEMAAQARMQERQEKPEAPVPTAEPLPAPMDDDDDTMLVTRPVAPPPVGPDVGAPEPAEEIPAVAVSGHASLQEPPAPSRPDDLDLGSQDDLTRIASMPVLHDGADVPPPPLPPDLPGEELPGEGQHAHGEEGAGVETPRSDAPPAADDTLLPTPPAPASAQDGDAAEEPSPVAPLAPVQDWEAWREWTAQCLIRVIGPIGPIVVSRLQDDAHPENLVEECARFIRDVDERAAFLRYVSERPGNDEAARIRPQMRRRAR